MQNVVKKWDGGCEGRKEAESMLDLSLVKIVKQGICLYDGVLEYKVIIIESDTIWGTGDEDDPPEIAEDREGLCYYAWWDSPSARGKFHAGCGRAFLSIEEAMQEIEMESYFAYWVENGQELLHE